MTQHDSVLDPDVIAKLIDLRTQDDPGFIGELALAFKRSAPGLLSDVEAALHAADSVTAAKKVHTLKSTLAAMGATHAAEVCFVIEEMALSKNLAGAQAQLPRAREEFARAFQAIEALGKKFAL